MLNHPHRHRSRLSLRAAAVSALAALSLCAVAGTAPAATKHSAKLSAKQKHAMRKDVPKHRPTARAATWTPDELVFADGHCSPPVGYGSAQGPSFFMTAGEPRVLPRNGRSSQYVAVSWGERRYSNKTIVGWDQWHVAQATAPYGFFAIQFNGPGAFTTYKTWSLATGLWDIGDYALQDTFDYGYRGDAYQPLLRVSWWSGTSWGPVNEYPVSVDGLNGQWCLFN